MELKELLIVVSGSVGIIGGLIPVAVFVYSRLDKKKEQHAGNLHEYNDAQKSVVLRQGLQIQLLPAMTFGIDVGRTKK